MDIETGSPPAAVLSAARRILRPLARLLLAHGVTFPSIEELMKRALVEVAENDFPVKGKPTNDSRISVITGVHRKDVKRLRHQPLAPDTIPKGVSLGSKVVNTWLTEPRWRHEDGTPKVLARHGEDGQEDSFEALAACISKDVHPRAILDELVRVGSVRVRKDKRVELNTQAFIPKQGMEERLYYLERAAYSHLMAAVQNVQGVEPPFFERIVHYDTIPAAALPELRRLVDQDGMGFLRKVNEVAKGTASSEAPGKQHFTVGVYLYTEPREDELDAP